MNNFFRAILAGAAAKKFGGGCLGTIVVFVLVWVALGQCNSTFPNRKPPQPTLKEKQVKTSLHRPASNQAPNKAAINYISKVSK